MPLTPELPQQLMTRARKLGYSPNDYLFRVTVADVLAILAERLAQSGTLPEQLSQPDLDYLLDQAGEYLNGDGLPWKEFALLGLNEAWPEHLQLQKEVP